MKKIILLILITVMAAGMGYPAARAEGHPVTLPLRFDYYYTYEMVVEALQLLHRKFPGFTRLEVVGHSEEDRAIYALTLHNPATGNDLDKPGIYVDGNIHGNEIQATEVCLYLADYLLHQYTRLDSIRELVDQKVFYIIPSVNVDGRAHFFEDATAAGGGNRGLRRPKDDDRDGLFDEDFSDDLDGDGNICQMRKYVPGQGDFKLHPDDPRLLVRVKPGERGDYLRLGSEGIDNDGDGRVNEDEEGYVDPNRNWGYDWAPNYVQQGAGDYPFSGVGLKGIARFIRKHPNICMAWAFHNTGGLIVRGPSTEAQGEYAPGDLRVYDYLGEQSERIIPGYRYVIGFKDMYSTYGDFGEWMMMINGAYTFIGELFIRSQETFQTRQEEREETRTAGEEEERSMWDWTADLEHLQFNDHLAHGSLFREWKEYDHPTYGKIEIGGWIKFSSRMPHPFMLRDLVHRNASAVIHSAEQTPEVTMEIFEKKKLESGLTRVRVRLRNSGVIPTMSHHARGKKLYPQDILKVEGPRARVIAGGRLLDPYRDTVQYKEHRPHLQFLVVDGFDKIELQFLISGKGPVTFSYHSRVARDRQQKVQL